MPRFAGWFVFARLFLIFIRLELDVPSFYNHCASAVTTLVSAPVRGRFELSHVELLLRFFVALGLFFVDGVEIDHYSLL